MKKITLSLLAVACSHLSGFSQALMEEFTSPFNPTAAGWIVQNNSTPVGPLSWSQGNSTGNNNVIPAYSGAFNDFYEADYFAVNNQGDISAWLITPVVNIYNGAVLQFAVRTASVPAAIYADRLQVRMTQQSANTTIPAGATSVGPFTDLLFDINPNLNTNYTSVVTGTTINGFPAAWTVVQVPISGITGTVQGRFAFRYFVTNGGANGANSRLIGLDAVKYTTPCETPVQSYTTCQGASTTLYANGVPANTYSWSTGSTNQSIIVNPSSTTVYTLYPSNNGVPCGNNVTATITTANSLGINIAATSTQVCAGTQVVLTAQSSASNYQWSTNETTAVISVTPSTAGTQTYAVGGQSGLCFGGNTIAINVLPLPSVSVALSPACLGGSLTVNASGAVLYSYLGSTVNPNTFPLAAIGATDAVAYTFQLAALGQNGCITSGGVTFSVNPLPVVAIAASKTVACINTTISMTANGATSYTWNYGSNQTSTATPLTFSTGSTAGAKSFTLFGVDANGCSAKAVKTVSVSACTGIEDIDGNVLETSVFPNPFTNELRVSGLSGKVEIFNALGQLIISTRVTDTETINTADLAKGAYILKAYSQQGQEVKTIKLLKN